MTQPNDPLSPQNLYAAAFRVLSENPRFKVGLADIEGVSYRVFENAPINLRDLLAEGASFGDREFLLFEGERYSFARIWRESCQLAHGLRAEFNVQKGDRVALMMRNYPEFCTAYMAVIMLGAVVVPINAWWREEELRFGLEDCGAKLAIVDEQRLKRVAPFQEALSLNCVVARADIQPSSRIYSYEALVARAPKDAQAPTTKIEPEDLFCIAYTSGSTGKPKGVMLSHRGAVNAVLSWDFLTTTGREALDGKNLHGDDPGILLAVPLFHVTGSHSVFMLSFVIGRRMTMMYRWDARTAIELIKAEKLTNFYGVPTQSRELVQLAAPDELSSLIEYCAVGAKRPGAHVGEITSKFEGARPAAGYGLTETNAIGCYNSWSEYKARPDAAGKPVPPLTDMKVMGKGGEVARGEIGELWIKSPSNFRGYLGAPIETAKVLDRDGWFHTGDLVKMDVDGFVYIVDRIKDIIIRGGENISCIEVENEAYSCSDIVEACAFSVPHSALGEQVGLVVYGAPGTDLDVTRLRKQLEQKLSYFKVPEKIWISPSQLPRLATGKIDKLTIKAYAQKITPDLEVAYAKS